MTAKDERTWGRHGCGLAIGLLIVNALTVAVPAANEPHYLTKARHFWQPEWCARDLFLESADAHVAFFTLMGWPTIWLGFPAAAWLGRILGTFLLTTGWFRLSSVLRCPPRVSWLAAAVFFLFQALGNFSGEWVLGGIEGKVLSYGFITWSAADWIRGRRALAGLWMGLAITFHPVVGMWAMLAAAGSGAWLWLRRPNRPRPTLSGSVILPLMLLVLFAVPGLWPALRLVTEPADPTTRYAGDYLQVFYRLAHHLDPMRFRWHAYACYAGLVVVWLAGWQRFRRELKGTIFADPESPPESQASDFTGRNRSIFWLQGIVACSVMFAIAGILIGYGPRPPAEMPLFDLRMRLLKFYPFRLGDVLLPCAVAWTIAVVFARSGIAVLRSHGAIAGLFLAMLLPGWLSWPGSSADFHPDWIAGCRWIRDNTPPGSLVQTPHGRFTFKWHAQRSEFVCYKDCPQNAAGIVEWNRRMQFLTKWYQEKFDDRKYSYDEMRALRAETGISHLMTDRLGPIELEPIYRNPSYRVYELPTDGIE